MAKKTSINEALEILEKYNFVLLSEFNSSKDYIKIMDSEGYFYHTTLGMFKRIEKTGSIPFRFSVSNPYTIDNIYNWVSKEDRTFTFEGGIWNGNGEKNSLFFKCKVCNSLWDGRWSVIFEGGECPYCNGKRVNSNNNLSLVRPDLVKEWDYKKNNKPPSEFTPRSEKTVWWKCSSGHSWSATISNRNNKDKKRRTNCPICNLYKGEKIINDFLLSHGIFFERQKRFSDCRDKRSLPFDFYIPEFNMCIEYQGEQHYKKSSVFYLSRGKMDGLKEIKRRDKIKFEYCLKNNIKLIEIPYWSLSNMDDILEKIFT